MAIYTRTGDKGETGLRGGVRTNKGSNQIMAIGAVDELNSHIGLSVAMLETVRMSANGEDVQKIEIGLAVIQGQLQDVQRRLFEIGAALAANSNIDPSADGLNPKQTSTFAKATADRQNSNDQIQNSETGNPSIDSGQGLKLETGVLEQWIDEMEKDLPELRNFILPGGGVVGAELMVARAVCRRSERELVRLVNAYKYKVKNQKSKIQVESDQVLPNINGEMSNVDSIMAYLNRLGDYLFVGSRWVNWLLREEEVIWKS